MRMTVQQLIEALQKFDSQKIVVVDGGNYITSIWEKNEKFLFVDDIPFISNDSDIWNEISYVEIKTTDK